MAIHKKKDPDNSFYFKKYNPPRHTPPLVKVVLVTCFSLVILFFMDLYAGSLFLSTEGSLSSSHSIWEKNCDSCHSPEITKVGTSPDNLCLNCHPPEKQFKLHISSHDPHATERRPGKELSCVQCHKEHRGRNSRVRETGDRQCRNCHNIHRAETDHPEFDPNKMESSELEQIGINFSHSSHLEIIIELGCSHCHPLDPDKNVSDIKKISFVDNCQGCHPLQELTITEIFPAKDLESVARSIKDIEKTLGLDSSDTFLSRFSYIKSQAPSSSMPAFQYRPIHKDSHLDIWFTNKKLTRKQVEAFLSSGPKGLVLNCLKCHVEQKNMEPDNFGPKFGPEFSFVSLSENRGINSIFQFPHKKHANESCDLCHENMFSSESLKDRNLNINKKTCFNCHNDLTVKSECVMCHHFH